MLDAREIGPGWDRDWTVPGELVRRELDAYLETALEHADVATRCPAWHARAMTAHLAATFERIGEQLGSTRAGDGAPPFPVRSLGEVNERAAAVIVDGPDDEAERLTTAVDAVLAAVDDPDEPIAHQRGLVPVGLQLAWLLGELAIHHDDVCWPASGREPGPEVVAAIAPAYEVLAGLPLAPLTDWSALLAFTGREPARPA